MHFIKTGLTVGSVVFMLTACGTATETPPPPVATPLPAETANPPAVATPSPAVTGSASAATPATTQLSFAGELEGRTFTATSVTENGQPKKMVSDTVVTITFQGGKATAQAGCNTISIDYTVSDNNVLDAGAVTTTEMGCSPDLMKQDQWLTSFLTSSPEIEFDEETLFLSNAKEMMGLTVINVDGGSGVPASVEENIAKVEVFCQQLITGKVSEQDAQVLAEREGYTVRVASRDGESFILTMDYSPTRISLEIQNGTVVGCTVG